MARVAEWSRDGSGLYRSGAGQLYSYAYADVNLTVLGCGRASFLVFRIVALIAVLTGSQLRPYPSSGLSPYITMRVLTLLNVIATLLLSPWAIAVLADYERSLAAGRKPVFVAQHHPWSARCISEYRLVEDRPIRGAGVELMRVGGAKLKILH